jgi:hypothetical protein
MDELLQSNNNPEEEWFCLPRIWSRKVRCVEFDHDLNAVSIEENHST